MEQSNFSSINRELTDDISGTEAEPVLVRVMKGKGGLGTVFVIKIGTLYFEMWQKRAQKAWIMLRCSKWKARDDKCAYGVRVVNLGGLRPEDPGFSAVRIGRS